jgi:hypothetical protein
LGKLKDLATVGLVAGGGYLAYKFLSDPLGIGGFLKGIGDWFGNIFARPEPEPEPKGDVPFMDELEEATEIPQAKTISPDWWSAPEEAKDEAVKKLLEPTARTLIFTPEVYKNPLFLGWTAEEIDAYLNRGLTPTTEVAPTISPTVLAEATSRYATWTNEQLLRELQSGMISPEIHAALTAELASRGV